MEKNNILTVVLPVYNGVKTVERTIKSLINQDFKEFKFLIVDNNSNDGTEKICQKYNDKYDFIDLITSDHTVPMSDNWNRFIEYTSSEYICMIHSDDYYLSNFVSEVFLILNKSNPDLIIFNANIIDSDESIINKLSYSKNELSREDVLEIFPGTQRHVWKRNSISKKFNGKFFPIFDYVWFYENIKEVSTIYYLNKFLVNITSDENQTTNKVSWELGIIKSLFFVIFKSKITEHSKGLKKVAINHLVYALKSSIYKRLAKNKLIK